MVLFELVMTSSYMSLNMTLCLAWQALPYVRCVGESWPMTIERAYFETTVLREHGRWAPDHVPEFYYFDHPMALTVMQYLEPPHIILRKGLIAGVVYPQLARDMAQYMASTLFNTSLLAVSTLTHREAGTQQSMSFHN